MSMQSQPFKRAIAMQNSIKAIIAKGGGQLIVQMAIDALGAYKSRGHGEGLGRNKHAKSSFKQNKRRGL